MGYKFNPFTGTLDEVGAGGAAAVNDIYIIAASDETTALTTGTAKVTFRMPGAGTLVGVKATLTTAPVGSALIVDINEAGASILSTKLSIDDGEKTSATAATPAVISDSALADDAEITIDIDQVGSTTAGAGLKIYLEFSGGSTANDIYVIACSDETTALTTGSAKVTFRMPTAGTLTGVKATATTAPVGSTLIVDVNEAGTSVLSTKLSIDDGEKTSSTAATAAVISDSALANDAEITVDIDQVGSTTAGAGLKVYLYVTRA